MERMLRRRDTDGSRVTTLELFFDLVYVFAVTQLAHYLLEHLTVSGAIRAGMLLLAVWWAWMYTTWFTNYVQPDQVPVRLVLIGVMLCSLVMSGSIPDAFDNRAIGFAGAFVAMQVLRTAFLLYCIRNGEDFRIRNFQRVLAWLVLGGIFWIAGIFVEGDARQVLWLVALAIDYTGPAVRFWTPGMGRSTTHDWDVSGEHMAERCRLFIIIALGESVLSTGRAFADHAITLETTIAFVAAFAGTVTLWWLYFAHFSTMAEHAIARSDDPGRLARSAYTYSHLLLVAGIVVSAVADELVVAHPTGHTDQATALVTIGGVGLFLAGYYVFKRVILDQGSLATLAAIGALLVLYPLHDRLSPLAMGALVLAVAATMVIAIEIRVRADIQLPTRQAAE